MNETQVQEIQKSVGETLGELRKQRRLSTQEIANQLRLDTRIIEALEAEDYDSLPSPAYIRGYLRSYAKILGVDPDKMISLYNHKAPQPPEIIPDVRHSTQVSSSDKPVKAFTYLVTFILVLLLFAWVQSNFVVKEGPGSVGSEPEVKFPTEIESYQPEGITGREEIPEDEGELTVPEPAPDVSIPEVSPEMQETTGAPETRIPAPAAAGEAGTEHEEQQAAVISSGSPQMPEEEGAPGNVVPDGTDGPDSISMKLTADSWIEVYDAFNNKLLTTLARSGDEINLKGTAPFHVKLGFSQGVVLYFNGQYFDPAPYSRGGVATFALGE